MRRQQTLSYKNEIIVLSGLDEGDMKAVDKQFKSIDAPCQLDKEDGRFVLKGACFNLMQVLNVLTEERGYKVEYNPQQHAIPPKQSNIDDKFALIYHLSKPSSLAGKVRDDPTPPPRVDSLGKEMQKQNINEVDLK